MAEHRTLRDVLRLNHVTMAYEVPEAYLDLPIIDGALVATDLEAMRDALNDWLDKYEHGDEFVTLENMARILTACGIRAVDAIGYLSCSECCDTAPGITAEPYDAIANAVVRLGDGDPVALLTRKEGE